jgi:glycosylphosphatidylinositol transamidase
LTRVLRGISIDFYIGLTRESLKLTSGVIWTALNIDYPGHSFSHLGVFFGPLTRSILPHDADRLLEGLNGRLPNQDLMNSFDRIARYTAGVPVTLYEHLDPSEEEPAVIKSPAWLPQYLYNISDIKSYLYQAKNVIRHMKYQSNGRGSGVHGLFHQ